MTNLVLQKASKDCGFGDLLTSVCSKCRGPRGTSNVEFLAHLKFPGFLKNLPFFLKKTLESLLDFKSADIESIEPTFVCIRSLRSDPPPIPNKKDTFCQQDFLNKFMINK